MRCHHTLERASVLPFGYSGAHREEGDPMRQHGAWPDVGREQKPWTRWWWLGSAVDEANLTRELESFRAAGFGGVEITPIYGIQGAEARHVPYLSDRWCELMAHACREARRLDLGVDIVPGTGWRLGGPDVPPKDRAVALRLHKSVKGDTVRYRAEAVPSGEPVKRPAPGGEGFSLDMLDRHAVARYLGRFNRRFFAKVPAAWARAQFHDSWEYETNWTPALPVEFKRRRGYGLQPFLGVFDPEDRTFPEDTAARVLYDYRATVEELVLENFASLWNATCKARGLLTRNQAHGCPGNLLDLYAVADIPETEIFAEGVNPLIQKFVSSAGHVAGRRLVSAESFTWLSNHWQSDLGKLKRYTDYLFLCGVNHIVCHGTAYSPDDVAWPGWLFYASTQLNDRNPIWRDWPSVAAYIGRCQALLQSGQPDEDVLVYWPVADLYMHPEGGLRHFVISGDRWTYGEALRTTAQALWDRGVSFDYVSDRQLQQAREADGLLRMPSGAAYSAVVLPPIRHLPHETARALARLARTGLRVVCVGDPSAWDVPGLAELTKRRKALRLAARSLRTAPAFALARDPVDAADRLRERSEPFQGATGLRAVRRRSENGNASYFLVNRTANAFDGWIRPSATSAYAWLRDAWTGAVGWTRCSRRGVRLQLEPWQSVFVEFCATVPEGPRWSYVRPGVGVGIPGMGPWSITFVAGGPVLPKPIRRKHLVPIARLGGPDHKRFGGTVRYDTTFDLPGGKVQAMRLDLGEVRQSARVLVNGVEVGVRVLSPFRFDIPAALLRASGNRLAVEVTTLAVNRIRDLDRRGVPWRIFQDINFVDDQYKPFDASGWNVAEEGLLGPVVLGVQQYAQDSAVASKSPGGRL